MRMNRYIFTLFMWIGILFSVPSNAQVLTAERHTPFSTDSLQVYKLSYIQVTDSGTNCIWDFSNLSVDSAEMIDVDYYPLLESDTTHFGCHRERANFYFHYSKDTLWQTGYETSRVHMRYSSPIPLLRFPFTYGDSVCGQFVGSGQYCHLVPLNVEGTIITNTEAVGKLLLPDMTIDTALCVHMRMVYHEKIQPQGSVSEERHSWYSPYCRYPLLESVVVQTIKHSDTITFATSYYLPQEETDKPTPRQEQTDNPVGGSDSLVTNVSYLPNPVYSDLQVRYTLMRPAQVYISVHYNGGVTTYQTPILLEDEGFHSIPIDMSGMPVGTYVVYIHADDMVISGNVIKL